MMAGVEGELAATGLAARELDLHASSLQQLHGRDTGSWPEEIHHARHKELSPNHCSRLTVPVGQPRRTNIDAARLESPDSTPT